MKYVRALLKPEYLFRPSQLVKRVFRPAVNDTDWRKVALPWGHQIRVNINEAIGKTIWQLGVYELSLSEVIHRLLGPGKTAVDVGANVGYVSLLMADCIGSTEKLISIEALPDIFQTMEKNVVSIVSERRPTFIPVNKAVSDKPGSVNLILPRGFGENAGIARVGEPEEGSESMTIEAVTLDQLLEYEGEVEVMKIDIEGHEEAAFKGASDLFEGGRIRNIVFEDWGPYPSTAMKQLQEKGFYIRAIEKDFFGPRLSEEFTESIKGDWEPRNFLATRGDIVEEIWPKINSQRGWKVLK